MCPDIAYAVNFAARYMFNPKHSYELALNIIGLYLKVIRNKVLVINPNPELNIDFYPDADFSGIYGHDKATDPSFVKSKTFYSVTVTLSSVLWYSKFQTETDFLAIEAEIIAMYHSWKELFLIMNMVDILGH